MNFFVLEKTEDGIRVARSEAISTECQNRMKDHDAKCLKHYEHVFSASYQNVTSYTRCPYGYFTSSALPEIIPPIVVSGISHAAEDAAAPERDSAAVVRGIEFAATAVHKKEYEHLEAALHDVRELNRAITGHVESLLSENGYGPGQDWNLDEINASHSLKKLFSIFAGTRDLRAALDLHELWRDPRSASNTRTRTHIHKHFFRQKQLVTEELREKQLDLKLGNTILELTLTESFLLIPKILIDNAIKYAEPRTQIRVEFIEGGNTFRIVVTNSGQLIKQAEKGDVFRRGYRGANAKGKRGSGIGLWLAKKIVEANNGLISFEIDETERKSVGQSFGLTKVTVTLIRSFS